MDVATLQDEFKGQIPAPVVAMAERLGLSVYETTEFPDHRSGSLRKENGDYAIYVNAKHAPWRKRFTIAHEIGHFLAHRDAIDVAGEHFDTVKQPASLNRDSHENLTPEQKKMEYEANEIAADLLMPKEEFLKAFEAANDITDVAKAFGVSTSAATVRALNLAHSYTS